MATHAEAIGKVANGRGAVVQSDSLAHLGIGTLQTLDLKRARHCYESYFGLECVEYAPGRMLCRDRRSKYLMEQGRRNFFVLDVHETDEIAVTQGMTNHWGFSVAGEDEVRHAREAAVERQEELGFAVIHPALNIHGSYSFYMYDVDGNWWEVEYRKGSTNDLFFSRGDWNSDSYCKHEVVEPELTIAHTECEVLGDEAFMTHGTTSVIDCQASRPFYEDVLGLRTVTHVRPSHCFAGGGDFGVIGVSAGEKKILDQSPSNRFVLLVDDDEQLEKQHERVIASRGEYGLLSVSDIDESDLGGRGFLLRTRDRIWFEVASTPRASLVEIFDGAGA